MKNSIGQRYGDLTSSKRVFAQVLRFEDRITTSSFSSKSWIVSSANLWNSSSCIINLFNVHSHIINNYPMRQNTIWQVSRNQTRAIYKVKIVNILKIRFYSKLLWSTYISSQPSFPHFSLLIQATVLSPSNLYYPLSIDTILENYIAFSAPNLGYQSTQVEATNTTTKHFRPKEVRIRRDHRSQQKLLYHTSYDLTSMV
jgi:hypothetical protein